MLELIEKNKVVLKEIDDATIIISDDFIIAYERDHKRLTIKSKKDLNLDFETKGDVNIKCRSYNVIADEEICFDSLLPENTPSLFLNSKMAKMIRNLPENIEYRKKKIEDDYLEEKHCYDCE